jgi:hypothetical protein
MMSQSHLLARFLAGLPTGKPRPDMSLRIYDRARIIHTFIHMYASRYGRSVIAVIPTRKNPTALLQPKKTNYPDKNRCTLKKLE